MLQVPPTPPHAHGTYLYTWHSHARLPTVAQPGAHQGMHTMYMYIHSTYMHTCHAHAALRGTPAVATLTPSSRSSSVGAADGQSQWHPSSGAPRLDSSPRTPCMTVGRAIRSWPPSRTYFEAVAPAQTITDPQTTEVASV